MPTPHLVIIDGHHLLYRAYWAIPRTMKTSKGEQVNTTFGLASMLLQILKIEQPTHILFCLDADEQTFRHKEYAEYKAGRAETPDDFYTQIPRALEFVDACTFQCVSGQGYEADDFACSYARAAERQGMRVTIVSGDRDLLQLASASIRIAIPHKGYQAQEYVGRDEVIAKYGITPEQVPSYKGLVGDNSDNLPGVHGIGPKAASELLKNYHTLEGIYANLPSIRSSWREKLEKDREQAFFCERMARLICDIPLPLPLSDLELQSIDTSPIDGLMSALEFSLVRRRFEGLLLTEYGRRIFLKNPSRIETALSPSHKEKVPSSSVESSQLSLL